MRTCFCGGKDEHLSNIFVAPNGVTLVVGTSWSLSRHPSVVFYDMLASIFTRHAHFFRRGKDEQASDNLSRSRGAFLFKQIGWVESFTSFPPGTWLTAYNRCLVCVLYFCENCETYDVNLCVGRHRNHPGASPEHFRSPSGIFLMFSVGASSRSVHHLSTREC